MKNLFYFGEKVKGFDVRVLNEREVRAGAGIMFLFAFFAFMNAFLVGNYSFLNVLVVVFFVDFFIRVFINPKFSPSLIIGRFFVQNQTVEYSGAPQKRFAWSLGLGLATVMVFLVVVFGITGIVNMSICLLCLVFLFFESVFGICVGCKLYGLFKKDELKHCPGGVCEIKRKEDIQKFSVVQIIIVFIFIAVLAYLILFL
ncbi:DUF4395 domain-containing protein [Candidatus Woesearchaeota archaeon]|nr:DUF4395 domain-containing protein [Candidatus Woesearchaeota archaeon]MCF7901476.1 DUF4395 domain-containing protein [Candidatus Woesearchaeota archaeon]MCF8013191.1 DUF4395 domain-containing protein [Candidatus Woesearchaeota archaeon]